MKTLLNSSLLFALLVITPTPCFALIIIEPVSKERAKQLGVELRLKGSGTNEVWVELEFKADGELKDFSHVSLEIREEGELLVGYVPLRGQPSDSGRVHVGFMANRAYLKKVILRMVTSRPKDIKGFDLLVMDFVDPEKLR
ncbi:MAG: hypothetical protein L0Z50_40215 [Verrucomicrobiales bacterium]|nr:hypothetical protein [Verrucomicrobiales bacterium]